MTDYIVNGDDLTAIANKIRAKGQTSAPITFPGGFEDAVDNLPDEPVLQALSVTANNTYTPGTGVDGFSSVSVNVQPVLEALSVTQNGNYTPSTGVDGFSSVSVNVSGGGDDLTDFIENRNTWTSYANLSASKIASYAFYSCISLNTVSFPACTSIGNFAFTSCSALTAASFPACTSIGNHAFTNCSALTAASFPACTDIGNFAFESCNTLTTVNFPACTSIGGLAFESCRALTTVNFPACTSIAGSAFASCRALTTVNFPACAYISNYVFAYCSAMTAASFPACTDIGGSAFQNCYRLKSLYLTGSQYVTLVNSATFRSTPIAGYITQTMGVYGSIYVPASMLESYKTQTNWTYFSDRMVGV